jgi:hypothetical protein
VKLPSKIRIKKSVAYDVVRQDRIKDDPDCLGLCDGESRIIFIKSGLSDSEELKTLIHEIFHAIEFEFDVPIPHATIHKLEAPIIRILKLNKWI